jgi:aerobic carbon-monoxide dehydrogenase small subunit
MPMLHCELNGEPVSADPPVQRMLIDWLRDERGLKGSKPACDQAVCGACTVLIDGAPVASCNVFAFEADGHSLTTIEGLAARDGTLHPVQQAFADHAAFQCGYCLAGLLLNTVALLAAHPSPTRAQVLDALDGCVCRCTGYQQVVDAVFAAARRVAQGLATAGVPPVKPPRNSHSQGCP